MSDCPSSFLTTERILWFVTFCTLVGAAVVMLGAWN